MDNNVDRRKIFMRLTDRERDAALYNMLVDEISERVKLMARIVELAAEVDGIGRRKDITIPVQDTTDKIKTYMASRFDAWVWFRDKVLPNIITLIVLAILYLTFGMKP